MLRTSTPARTSIALRSAIGRRARTSSMMPLARTDEPSVAAAGSGHSRVRTGPSSIFFTRAMLPR